MRSKENSHLFMAQITKAVRASLKVRPGLFLAALFTIARRLKHSHWRVDKQNVVNPYNHYIIMEYYSAFKRKKMP